MNKKIFYFAAAAALTLTACTSEEDFVQTGEQTQAESRAIAFDTYTAGTTRAGDPVGVMNTEKLKTADKGFGVFAMFEENNTTYAAAAPDFMYNEHVSWNNGWAYSPLKYWPNETTKDSQDPAATAATCDGISFFAYAPYVSTGAGGTLTTKADDKMVATWSGSPLAAATYYDKAYYSAPAQTSGILTISAEDKVSDPLVEWAVSTNPDQNVDLLWGVAPAGMTYTAVNGNTVSVPVGMPLKNLVKPDKDQKVKFLFQHALSRIGLSVVSAIDQIAAGDDASKYNTAETRVLIEEVKIFGDNIGVQGVLNLNNTDANVANWIETSVKRMSYTDGTPLFTINATNGYLAPDLRYDASVMSTITGTVGTAGDGDASKFVNLKEGVLPSEKTLMVGGPDPSKEVTNPTYTVGTVLYKKETAPSNDYEKVVVEPSENVDVYVADGNNYNQVAKASANEVMDGSVKFFKIVETSASGTSADGVKYYTKTGTASDVDVVYTLALTGDGSAPIPASAYTLAVTELSPATSSFSGTYYTGLLPRYFMVIPSKVAAPKVATNLKVKITYRVVTKDTKLTDYVSNISNAITKSTDIQLENGKSYNLKLILGLTSVKLDATVADWKVADDAEIWLPQNVD